MERWSQVIRGQTFRFYTDGFRTLYVIVALLFAGCITTRTGPHDTPVVDGQRSPIDAGCGRTVELSVDLTRCRWVPRGDGGFLCMVDETR